jgi:hypothetical protein
MPEIDWVTILREGGLIAVIGVGLVVALIIYVAKWVPQKPPKEDPAIKAIEVLAGKFDALADRVGENTDALGEVHKGLTDVRIAIAELPGKIGGGR